MKTELTDSFLAERGLLDTVLQSVDEGVLVISTGLRLLYANRAAEVMVGFSFEQLHGQRFSRYLREWGLTPHLTTPVGQWASIATQEVELTYPEHRFVAYYARPIRFEGQTEILILLRDVTRQHQAEAEALADERLAAVKTLAAGVAHEIGNPLNALSLHLQLLTRQLRTLEDARQRETLQSLTTTAAHEVDRLDAIIRRFLTAIRPTPPKLVAGDLRDVLGTTLRTLAPDLEQRRISLEQAIPEDLPKVWLDAQQIEQVLFNLLKNAMDAVCDGGRIGVTLTADDACVNLSILDNGEGIPPEMLGRIFDPYVTTKAKGNGLGLMIVRRILQAHGGSIECASRPGEGTCFTLHLPRAERRIRTLPQSPND